MPNPSRVAPQTDKVNNVFTSLIKTLGLCARYFPDGKDKGIPHAARTIERLVPWHPEEMETLRGEPFGGRSLVNLLSSMSREKYASREAQATLSLAKQAECRLAEAILLRDEPLTREEFRAMFLGVYPNLRGLKKAYEKKLGESESFLSIR